MVFALTVKYPTLGAEATPHVGYTSLGMTQESITVPLLICLQTIMSMP